jgi:aspartate aminotransferase
MVAEFDERRRFIVERLDKIPGIQCPMPNGAFYVFPSVGRLIGRRTPDSPITSSATFASYLLKEARVATVPGEAFGAPGHLRLSYATGMKKIEEGITRIESAVARLS